MFRILQYTILVVLFLFNKLNSQKRYNIDSLQKILQGTIPDTVRVNCLNSLSAWHHAVADDTETAKNASEALALAGKINFMSLLNMSFLNEAINEKKITDPGAILNHVREKLIHNLSQDGNKDGMDCVLVSFDLKAGHFYHAAANNNFYLVRVGKLVNHKADKMPVGKSPKDHESFNTRKTELNPGDTLYLFTDGYADQFGGPKGKKFKYKQLEELLLDFSNVSLPEQRQQLDEKLEAWKGSLEQVDDILLIGIRI